MKIFNYQLSAENYFVPLRSEFLKFNDYENSSKNTRIYACKQYADIKQTRAKTALEICIVEKRKSGWNMCCKRLAGS